MRIYGRASFPDSGTGVPHSKTLARRPMRQNSRSVLECGSPLPLSSARAK